MEGSGGSGADEAAQPPAGLVEANLRDAAKKDAWGKP